MLYYRTIKVKVKLSLCFFLTEYHAMKVYWGNGGIAPHTDLGTRWKWEVSFKSQPLNYGTISLNNMPKDLIKMILNNMQICIYKSYLMVGVQIKTF